MINDPRYKIETLQFDVDMAEAVATCMDYEMCAAACRECPNYGRLWTCPPFVDDRPALHPERFGRLRLYVTRITFVRRSDPNVFYAVKNEIISTLKADNAGLGGVIYGFAGRCDLCAECARLSSLPCRHPESATPSLEGVGFDVGKVLKRFCNLELEWTTATAPSRTLTYVAAIAH